ncbi:sugar porter family MFS transporter [Polaribacter sp. PL03]|uniref:sugar porter family MFS transporter n=1 Tax=Polaribacter sp. PL03 TaxID=3088353 RepID=UPI0029CE8076|nr:sugar porter family MFS transporter [Polaribacter sp. PL03]MDX6746656.1 sugar porter family MFS transporter [Polaribacter sp. PL03]
MGNDTSYCKRRKNNIVKNELTKTKNMSTKKFFVIKIAAIVALGGFLLGFDASVISGVVKFIEPEFNLTKLQLGWAVSSITLTAAVGMLIAGPMSDKHGRRRILKFAAILFTISAVGSALAGNFFWLIIFRMIGGFAVGAALIIAPMYIAEVAPPEKRGQLVSFNQLNIVLGISIAFFTNYLILKWGNSDAEWTKTLGFDKWNWRWMLGLEAVPAIFYYLGLNLVPKSPRWLMTQNEKEEALTIMKKVVSDEEAVLQMNAVEQNIHEDKNKAKSKVSDLFKKSMRKVIIIGIIVGVFQQIVGINAVLFYAPMIFEQTGIGTNASFIQAALVGVTNLGFTIVAMLVIDKFGRKPLLIIGMAGISICLFLLSYGFNDATYTLSQEAIANLPKEINHDQIVQLQDKVFENDLDFKAAIVSTLGEESARIHESTLVTASAKMNTLLILIGIIGFVGAFAMSIGPVMWVLFSELFPTKIRGIAIAFVGFINLGVGFLVQLLFPWELASLGNAGTFLLFGIFAVIGFVFIWLKVPETKGKSLEELEEMLVK